MGTTLSICDTTNLILDMALSQAGPLYYENKVQPGQCWRKAVGKVQFTVEAKCYTGEDNVYTDWSVAKPIIAYSFMGIGIAATAGSVAPLIAGGLASSAAGTAAIASSSASFMSASSALSGATLVTGFLAGAGGLGTVITTAAGVVSTAGGAALEFTPADAARVIEKLSQSSAGWYCGEDRTLYICGGPPPSSVKHESNALQYILITDDNVPPLYITEECPAGFTVTKYIE